MLCKVSSNAGISEGESVSAARMRSEVPVYYDVPSPTHEYSFLSSAGKITNVYG